MQCPHMHLCTGMLVEKARRAPGARELELERAVERDRGKPRPACWGLELNLTGNELMYGLHREGAVGPAFPSFLPARSGA